jgi:hypothetical protein
MDVWPKTERRHSLLQAQPAHCDKPASAYITAVSQTFRLQFGACRVHTDASCKHKVRRSTRYSPGHAEEAGLVPSNSSQTVEQHPSSTRSRPTSSCLSSWVDSETSNYHYEELAEFG